MNRRQVREAMDKSLAPLVFTQGRQAEVLSIVKGEKKVKKKLSVGLVLALALALIAVTALAVVTLQETGRLIAQTEQEHGYFADWPVEKKAAVIGELMDEGLIAETAELRQLRDGALSQEEAERVASEAMAAFVGEESRYASFLSIMQAAWGPFSEWSYERQAWYSQVMEDVGANTEGETFYVEPSGSLTDQQAVAIAKRAIAKGFGVEESALDGYRVETSFQIPEFAEPGDTQAYWYVCLDSGNTGVDVLPYSFFEVFVHPDTGELLQSVESILAQRKAWQEAYEAQQSTPVAQAIREFDLSSGEEKQFEHWSLENKARWAAEVAPLVNAYLAEHPGETGDALPFSTRYIAIASYQYGLPDEKAISQEEAIRLSRTALREACQLSDEEISLLTDSGNPYYTCPFYDVTDPARPLWKFIFEMPSSYAQDEALAARAKALYGRSNDYNHFYKVEINAYTGEVVRTLAIQYMPDTLEQYKDAY